MNPDHLRAAIEKIGIEKPSDYILVLEEVGRMEAEEKLVEKAAKAAWRQRVRFFAEQDFDLSEDDPEDMVRRNGVDGEARAVLNASGLLPLLTASEAFIREAEEMGWGKTSDKALPGSWDALIVALEEVKK